MSIIFAAVGTDAAAMAGDSLYVDLVSGVASSTAKVKCVGARLVGVAGVINHNGFDVLAAAEQALLSGVSPQALGDSLMQAHGDSLLALYVEWRRRVGLGPRPEDCVALVVAEPGQLVEVWTQELEGRLVLVRQTQVVVGAVVAQAAGSADDVVVAHTDHGRLLAASVALERSARLAPAAQAALPADSSGDELLAHVEAIVAGAIGRQGQLPRPAWWPEGVPLLAGPVLGVVA